MSQKQYVNVAIDVWGDFAMFTMPQAKVERITYRMPTPSACRGILNAIYSKPVEFYYEITSVELINPIRLIALKRNEIQNVVNEKGLKQADYHLYTNEIRTQRMCTYLRDVYYRIHAKLVRREDAPSAVNLQSLKQQFYRRVQSGKCFYQPVLGTRECTCYFSKVDATKEVLDVSETLGLMLYDVFDITNNVPLDTRKSTKKKKVVSCEPNVSFFQASLDHGVMRVPSWESDEIFVRRNQQCTES